jgi:methionine-rich copper-binding protein CopC
MPESSTPNLATRGFTRIRVRTLAGKQHPVAYPAAVKITGSIRRKLFLWGLTAAWLLVLCAPALAHSTLVEATPAEGDHLLEPPDRVVLRFAEPVEAEFRPLKVYDSGGERVDEEDARTSPEDATLLEVNLMPDLPGGSYTVDWRVTSLDGHVIAGEYVFTVAAATGDPEASGEPAQTVVARKGSPPAELEDTGGPDRLGAYGVLLLGALALPFLAVLGARKLRRQVHPGK